MRGRHVSAEQRVACMPREALQRLFYNTMIRSHWKLPKAFAVIARASLECGP